MKVLMLGWEYPPDISGGLGVASQGLAIGLSQVGVSIDFVVPKLGKKIQASSRAKRLQLLDANDFPTKGIRLKEVLEEITSKITYLEIGSRLMPYLTQEEFRREARVSSLRKKKVPEEIILDKIKLNGGYGEDLLQEIAKYGLAVLNVVKDREFDVIHAHDWMTFEAGVMAKEASKKPLILHVHSTEFDRSAFQIDQSIYEMERSGLHRADLVVAVSQRIKKILIDHYGLKARDIVVSHNGVSTGIVKTPQIEPAKTPRVLFVGRLTEQKGPSKFLDIAIELHRRMPELKFTVAGDGNLRAELEDRVAKMNLTSVIDFVGFKAHSAMPKLMASHDLVLLPSISEPFGIAAMEAIVAGTPVIVSKSSGVTESVRSLRSLDYWDTFQWIQMAENLLRSKAKSKQYWSRLFEDTKRLQWKFAAAEVKELYQSLS